jgi:hypothetical protein
MSSWINRHIPRKRDISQIPEYLRPQVIQKTIRPEVLISESFQEVSQNKIIIESRNNEPKKVVEIVVNPRQYDTKKINTTPNPTAFELMYKDKSFVFVILRHLRNTHDNYLWISSYNSIRKFYTNKIVIIDDNSSINTIDGKLVNAEVIKSEFSGAGEILPYYYFYKYKWANKMIFLHDSMSLNRRFIENEIKDEVKFHWYFHNYEVRDTRKILQYISMLNNNKNLYDYANNPESSWKGCFGAATIIDIDTVSYLETKYNLFSTLVLSIKTRLDRETFERIIGIVLYYEGIAKDDCSNFGNIVNYPGAFESENSNPETSAYILRQRYYNTAIIKVWRGR